MVYLLNYMLEIRQGGPVRAAGEGGGDAAGSAGAGGGGGGGGAKKKQPVIISLDEARLMFWLEVQVLFEMSAVMAPSREDMGKVYDKFFRPGSGFYVQELADRRQVRGGGKGGGLPQEREIKGEGGVHQQVAGVEGEDQVRAAQRVERSEGGRLLSCDWFARAASGDIQPESVRLFGGALVCFRRTHERATTMHLPSPSLCLSRS